MRLRKIVIILLFVASIFFKSDLCVGLEEDDFFPLSVGNSWTYRVTNKQDKTSLVNTNIVTGKETVNNKDTFVSENKIVGDNFVLKKRYFYEENDQLILAQLITYHIATRKTTYRYTTVRDIGDVIENIEPGTPMIYLQYPLKKGLTWVSQGGHFTVMGQETITVPAGTFKCWKVKLEFIGEQGAIYRYYADGIGLVKDETINPKFFDSISELVEYKIQPDSM